MTSIGQFPILTGNDFSVIRSNLCLPIILILLFASTGSRDWLSYGE